MASASGAHETNEPDGIHALASGQAEARHDPVANDAHVLASIDAAADHGGNRPRNHPPAWVTLLMTLVKALDARTRPCPVRSDPVGVVAAVQPAWARSGRSSLVATGSALSGSCSSLPAGEWLDRGVGLVNARRSRRRSARTVARDRNQPTRVGPAAPAVGPFSAPRQVPHLRRAAVVWSGQPAIRSLGGTFVASRAPLVRQACRQTAQTALHPTVEPPSGSSPGWGRRDPAKWTTTR